MKMLNTILQYSKNFGAVMLVALSPIRDLMIGMFILVCLDFVSGLLAAYVEKEVIESHKMQRTVVKLLAYEGAIIFAFIFESYFSFGVPLVKGTASIIALTELTSFNENFYKITKIDVFKKILKILKK